MNRELEIETGREIDLIDITERIEEELEGSGLCNVFVPHTTAGLLINENEEGLTEDIREMLQEIVPEKNYNHDQLDDNASSHLRQMLLDAEITLPVEDGELDLGTWQSVFLVELDGPRTRKVRLEILD